MKTKILFLLTFLIFLSLNVLAQISLSASVDKEVLTLDDEITLIVKLSGVSGNVVMPTLPSLPAFNVYSRQVEQSSINGISTFLFKYTMLPRFVGKATIGSVTFEHQGKKYTTQPISVEIYKTTQDQPTTDQVVRPTTNKRLPFLEADLLTKAGKHREPFFMVASVSNLTPYVNQSLILAVRFYYSQEFYDAPYVKPTVSNIFMEDLPSAKGTQTLHGKIYQYEEQRYHLSAVAPGVAAIGPASVQFQTGSSPFSPFDRLFGGSAVSEPQVVSSEAITLQVKDLPTPRPISFYGAVGEDFSLTSQTTPKKVEVGEAVNFSLTISGTGNLKSTKDIQFPTIEGFRSYPSASSSTNLSKTFTEVLVPTSSGTQTIPSVEWSFFNPKTQQYVTLQSKEEKVLVIPSTKQDNSFNFSNSQSMDNGFQNISSDIAYVKTNSNYNVLFLNYFSNKGLITLIIVTLSLIITPLAILLKKSLRSTNPFTQAKNKLHKAQQDSQIAEILSNYLQQKMKIRTTSQTLKDINKQLFQKGITQATIQSFSLLWERLEAARFAPSELANQNNTEIAMQALDVIKLLEGEIK